jgi:N-acetylneuraminic acid mutarotase
VIGGLTTETGFLNGKAIAAVEEYDPVTNAWTSKADMPDPRGSLPKASPVVHGKIYVIGGGSPAVARVDIYDPITDTWTRGTDMPTRRLLQATATWNGEIYVFGGITSVPSWQGQILDTTEVYDPQTDTWRTVAPMPLRVWEQSAEVIDGKIYVLGGASGTNAVRILQVYDPQTDTWANGTPLGIGTRGFGATVLCGNIYAFGGWLNSGQRPYSNTWVYNSITDTWTEGIPLPDTRAGLSTSLVNGKIYAIGGTPRPHNCQATSTVYELNLDFPPPDFNGDGVVNGADVAILVEHWDTDDPYFDIAPRPCGDGIVDTQDLLFLAESIGKEVQDPTLAAHWALDEAEGAVALDSVSDNGDSDGYVIGDPVWQPDGGKVDGAIQLDGIDDAIITAPVLNTADGPFSVLAWIKGGAPGQAIISESSGPAWLSLDSLTGNFMTELASAGRGASFLLSQTVIDDGNWHRVGLVWDGMYRTLYVDGVAIAEDTQNGLASPANGFYIGTGKNMAPGTYFSGLIDDVRIYNRAVRP